MKHGFILRNALVPYIYTNARQTLETGVAIVHPMYYNSPDAKEAYDPMYGAQYMFGSDIVVGPITAVTGSSGTVSKSVWLPSGSWSNWNGTKVYQGPTVVTMDYGVQDIPAFVSVDAVIPLQTQASLVSSFADPIIWTIFPGGTSGAGQAYEDDGETLEYFGTSYSTTGATFNGDPKSSRTTISIKPTTGSFTGIPLQRTQMVQIRGVSTDHPGGPKSVTANGTPIPAGTGTPGWYISQGYGLDITEGALVISAGRFSVQTAVTVDVQF